MIKNFSLDKVRWLIVIGDLFFSKNLNLLNIWCYEIHMISVQIHKITYTKYRKYIILDEVVRGILNDAKNFWFYFLILGIVRMFANKQICLYKCLKIRYIAKIFCMNTRFQGLGWQIKKCQNVQRYTLMYKNVHWCTKVYTNVQ